ncbi:MAG: Mpo1-like protein [Hyalangium sp.]|uniref:Mpo1-like protein n=1 Tax=Hyalangium sp. TaxID=2028555 RepID=UPI00389A3198
MSERLRTYDEFWPFYLREHSRASTRWLHFVGTSLGLGSAVSAGVWGRPWLLLGFPVIAYGMAWIGHFGIEKNRPATFKYPLWSLISDFRMLGLMAVGQLGPHLERAEAARRASGGSPVQAAPSR